MEQNQVSQDDGTAERFERGKGVRRVPVIIFAVIIIIGAGALIMKPWERLKDPDDIQLIDLTSMSSTMVYAYVNDMVNTRPESYIGKTVKARGEYYSSYYERTGQYYNFVIINDATSCCSQGLEFIFDGNLPAENTGIIIEGTFEKYEELGSTYYHIVVSVLSVA